MYNNPVQFIGIKKLSHCRIYVFLHQHRTCGNPVTIVTGGNLPILKSSTTFARRQHFLESHDWIRTGLMFEPRGHDMISGSILYPPTREDCDVAILLIETSGCLPMCVTAIIEQDLVTPKMEGMLRLDTPAGIIEAHCERKGDHVERVRIVNVPSRPLLQRRDRRATKTGNLQRLTANYREFSQMMLLVPTISIS